VIFPDVDSHPDADAELEAAVDRYLAYSADSAERFLNAVGKLVVDLCKWPQSGRVWEPWEREPTVYTVLDRLVELKKGTSHVENRIAAVGHRGRDDRRYPC